MRCLIDTASMRDPPCFGPIEISDRFAILRLFATLGRFTTLNCDSRCTYSGCLLLYAFASGPPCTFEASMQGHMACGSRSRSISSQSGKSLPLEMQLIDKPEFFASESELSKISLHIPAFPPTQQSTEAWALSYGHFCLLEKNPVSRKQSWPRNASRQVMPLPRQAPT